MKLNNERLEDNRIHDNFIKDRIEKIGMKKTLIRIKYDEPLTMAHIKKKLKQFL